MGNLKDILVLFEAGTVARLFRFLLEFAEVGAGHKAVDTLPGRPASPPIVHEHDPMYSPHKAAEYLGISWPTMRDIWIARYNIQSQGAGKGRRFRLSELNRIMQARENE